jgi:hypothetical protein
MPVGPAGKAPANNLFPSADEHTEDQLSECKSVCVHVAPESSEIQTSPPFAAIAFVPSAELAIEFQFVIGASDSVQSKPELVEK